MSKTTYVITGGNRGIGLALAKQFASDESNLVIATTRDTSKKDGLAELISTSKNVRAIQLDLKDDKSIDTFGSRLGAITDGIDVFISNAAISEVNSKALDLKREGWVDHYKVNSLGPILMLQQVYPLLSKRTTKKVVFISSIVARMSEFAYFPSSAYGQSKVALNFAVQLFSHELAAEGFTVIATNPGFVTSDMGQNAIKVMKELFPGYELPPYIQPITPEESAVAQQKVIEGLTKESNGKFYNYDGNELTY